MALSLAVLGLTHAALAMASGPGDVAALQIGLRGAQLYDGAVDGVMGATTTKAVRELQRRAGLTPDGIAGPATLGALGTLGAHAYGSRPLRTADTGRDVAQLQFELARHGFPSARFDGVMGTHLVAALMNFEHWAGLPEDGIAGPAVFRALRAPPPLSPVRLLRPIAGAPLGDRFGPRGAGFHAGLDFPAPSGTPVTTAGFGRVMFVGYGTAGWGNLVIVGHRFGLTTYYAHLSTIAVAAGAAVTAGQLVGTVGATGDATGPHLHFEVRLRGAAVDPLSAIA